MLNRIVFLLLFLIGCGEAKACPNSFRVAHKCVGEQVGITPTPTATPTATPTPTPTPDPGVPDFATSKTMWETNMDTYGPVWCLNPLSPTDPTQGTDEQRAWYYDGLNVYKQIRDYTGESQYDDCVSYYRTFYKAMIDEPGTLPGRRAWAHGLEAVGDTTYLDDLLGSVTYSNLFHNCSDPDSAHKELVASREVAYLLRNIIRANANGYSSPWTIDNIDPTDQCTNLGGSHTITAQDVKQFVKWHVTRFSTDSTYVQAFMAALSASALMEYHDTIGDDSSLPELIQDMADWLWDHAWQSESQKFRYCTLRADDSLCLDPSDDPYSADLNLLIAPMYAWLYKEGYGTTYRDKFDRIFRAGVSLDDPDTGAIEGPILNYRGKPFSQSYKESFDAVEWRETGP